MSTDQATHDRPEGTGGSGTKPRESSRRLGIQPFNVLRYFSWASFAVIALVFVASGSLTVYVVHCVHIETEEDEADSLAEAFVGALKPLGLDQTKWPQDEAARQVQGELPRMLDNFNVLEFHIFSPAGDSLACLGPEARDEYPPWAPGLKAAMDGAVKTRWEAENWWRFLFPDRSKRDIIETYVPVKEGGRIIAIAEVRRDLAKTLGRTRRSLPQLMLVAAAASLSVFLCLRVAIRRADRIMRQQRSEIERINKELEQRNKYLEAYDKRKDEFLSICSHDVRSPLMSIVAGCQVLLKGRKGPLNDVQREIIEHSVANAQAVIRLTEALLDLARIEAGQEALNLDHFDPVQVIRESLAAHQAQVESQGVAFDLQAPAHPVTLKADRLKILRVCNNLVSNAAKHSRHGVIRIRVETGNCTASGAGVLRIAVTDCGQGIKPEDMERLFDRFSTLSRRKRTRMEGTGLGLSITRALVELHGGTIEVASQEGKGATFTVTLPLVCEEQAPPASVLGKRVA
ncbi:MAG: HAMP domain-containing sensor histidine kinase [Planctomycetota bacterium]|nr:HAMP domain-containing sensor histidine kinase [Planctomycetota bacterium]